MSMEIAVYGKGGIGKSTVSANLAAALAASGRRVLQIGCDPKHDSTRLLVHGREQMTVLDLMRSNQEASGGLPGVAAPDEFREEDKNKILLTGAFGVGCIEAGGPKPGIGCAGRGIISAFEFLNRYHVKEDYDIVLYDVLGDVVCGGFAVPVRREYADAVYLVTSGEFMSLYAANNILRGIRNFDEDRFCRVAGIIYNERRIPEEEERIRRFADAVQLPVCARIPRDGAFAAAEQRRMTLMEMEGNEEIKEVFRQLAGDVESGMPLYAAEPLLDEELEAVVLRNDQVWQRASAYADPELPLQDGESCKSAAIRNGRNLKGDSSEIAGETAGTGKVTGDDAPRTHRPPLYGCAFNGAATTAVHLTDACVIAHSPRACAFYTWQNISSPGRKNLFHRGIVLPSAIDPNFECTDMTHAEAVFGGLDRVRQRVREKLDAGVKTVVVISSCVSGIIGDDIRELEQMSGDGKTVIAVHADGVIAGDYMEGIRMTLRRLGECLTDASVQPSGRRVNLINETGVSVNKESNYKILCHLLEQMDISVHCRFLGDASSEQVRTLKAAPLNLLAAESEDGYLLRNWMEKKWGCRFLDEALPVGVEATAAWLRKVAAFFDGPDTDRAEALIAAEQEKYRLGIERLRPLLAGKKIMITTINSSIDWILNVIEDLGMVITQIGVLNYLNTEIVVSRKPGRFPIDERFPWEQMEERIREQKPDIFLSNYTPQISEGVTVIDAIPMQPLIGFTSGLAVAERWASLLEKRTKGEWRNDRELYEQYYA